MYIHIHKYIHIYIHLFIFLEPKKKQRLLLCAPSNAAVDELLLRLLGGVHNAVGVLWAVLLYIFITIYIYIYIYAAVDELLLRLLGGGIQFSR
jgi:hypothetical protein